MTSPTSSDAQIAQAVNALATHPRIREVTTALRQATTDLRWHEALRRRWHEAREEASVLSATTQARIEGVSIQAADIRQRIVAAGHHVPTGDNSSLDVAMGLWRANARITTMMSPLALPRNSRTRVGLGVESVAPVRPSPTTRTPAPMLVGSIHRDVMAPLVLRHATGSPTPLNDDELLSHVATIRAGSIAPQESAPCPAPLGEECVLRSQSLMALISAPGCDAVVRASLVHAEMLCVRPFLAANGAVARVLTRYLIQRDGLDPAGCVLTDIDLLTKPVDYQAALAAYASGEIDGVVEWVCFMASVMTQGAQYAMDMCTSIQAGEPLV
ncbi:Fic family protein [Actinomyces vulturis]|uniref:Fic family protein n=1 Tax=Actinomyces vulturis TaxID=1857645 RepID=UPI00082EFAAA|nr:Fic family protein [Actinomyces vulturis]